MNLNDILMHYRAARELGREEACTYKPHFDTEENANRIVMHMNRVQSSIGRRERKETYPCPFCHKWHIGRELSWHEREKWMEKSGGYRN